MSTQCEPRDHKHPRRELLEIPRRSLPSGCTVEVGARKDFRTVWAREVGRRDAAREWKWSDSSAFAVESSSSVKSRWLSLWRRDPRGKNRPSKRDFTAGSIKCISTCYLSSAFRKYVSQCKLILYTYLRMSCKGKYNFLLYLNTLSSHYFVFILCRCRNISKWNTPPREAVNTLLEAELKWLGDVLWSKLYTEMQQYEINIVL